ncbi:MAG: Multiple RNA-binding domain-containing protein 1 [Vezdaea aestivalis]|nr:MAG: Multiple RNA-binding domain-containing protein 1 [Vezdaea aestivalis]
MASSRIYIHGLPPNYSEGDLRAYFSKNDDVTDVKYISRRRIGFVGYKTPDAASAAVDYFDRNFIKTSKIAVEIANPINNDIDRKNLKRKREVFQPSQVISKALEDKKPADGSTQSDGVENDIARTAAAEMSNGEWLRARTSRVLGFEDGEILVENAKDDAETAQRLTPEPKKPAAPEEQTLEDGYGEADDENIALIRESRRLFVYLPVSEHEKSKGFAFVLFDKAEAAIEAYRGLDGTTFQGRILHVIPARPFKKHDLDETAIAALPPKAQNQARRKMRIISNRFNWNSMFMSADAVMSSVADRLKISKADLLDPSSSDATVRQAHAETHVIQDAKKYFEASGVDLAAFGRREKGEKAFLIKNFSYDTSAGDLRALLEPYGQISRLLVPPSGTIAVAEFVNASQAQSAYSGLRFRTVKGSQLMLEKAPVNLFKTYHTQPVNQIEKHLTTDSAETDLQDTSTLYVSNLNFSTRSEGLGEALKFLDGLVSATVKTKRDPNKAGATLSMGFGFLEFKSKAYAQAAQSAISGFELDGHKLLVKASHKGLDAADSKRRLASNKAKKTKIIIKNLPFQATTKDVRALLGTYGKLRSVRIPTKWDNGVRGFGFADFVTSKEAENAMDALRDTHFYGRKLVLDWAVEEAGDTEEEIARMQHKAGHQAAKVTAQQLTNSERKKFTLEGQDAE